MPRVHLVTYATRRFRLRQIMLGSSAWCNRVVDTVTAWTPELLALSNFPALAPEIKLSERGSGFWSWKPYVILEKLKEVPAGDVVFYCDVGRLYPFKLLDQPITHYLEWMKRNGQSMMPGVMIPWAGSVAAWTKREVLCRTNMDRKEIHSASPIQASFSLWIAGNESRALARQWLELCVRRPMVSDDPSAAEFAELPTFRAHRHDQALLTLCCLQSGIAALDIGREEPSFDARHPSMVSRQISGEAAGYPTTIGRSIQLFANAIGTIERLARNWVRFGKPIHE